MIAVIKLGGSLLAQGREILHRLSDYAATKGVVLIIVPGGGPFVEPIRALSRQGGISDEAAHWMAVLAMHQYGFFLADGTRTIPLVERIEEIRTVKHICIVLPYTILKADDTLPHTWDVTSDTIAAFIALTVGETRFIKVTDVDGILAEDGSLIKEISAHELIEKGITGCVDAELPKFLMRTSMSCVIVNGNVPERIIEVIEGRETICTSISLQNLSFQKKV
ncbi:MAG: amino acid kinase [Methanophagales archaeon ANME-1-THS]|nr:MAG: amino acid kinase [Methanophagales archaeon ANME-1-THS]